MSCGEDASFEGDAGSSLLVTSALGSPGTCSFNDEQSLSRSMSSGCLSITCSETDIGDDSEDGDEAFADVLGELPGSDKDAAYPGTFTVPQDQVGNAIRDDLDKQDEARAGPKPDLADAGAGAPAGCGAARRLPSTHRSLIVGWMREVARALRLHMSTLFTAVSLLDRFVESAAALPPDGMLQLLALACVSVAVKYSEVGLVRASVWLGLAVDATGRRLYTAPELQRMEWSLLQATGWKLHTPNTHSFLEHFLLAVQQTQQLHGAQCAKKAACCCCCSAGTATAFCPTAVGACAASADLVHVLACLTTESTCLRAWPVPAHAMALAEMSLMYDTLLPYDHSTVALACVVLAERLVAAGPSSGTLGAFTFAAACCTTSPASSSVSAASGLRLERLAPGLQGCMQHLEGCCRGVMAAGCTGRV